MRSLLLVALALPACGSSTPVLLGDGSADLAVTDGGGLKPLDLTTGCSGNQATGNISGLAITTKAIQNGALVVNNLPVITISDWQAPGDVCTGAQPNAPAWSIVLKPNGATPGSYTVTTGGAAATYYEVRAGMAARPYDGISGNIVLTNVTATMWEGTFDITFSTGGLANGCFSVPKC